MNPHLDAVITAERQHDLEGAAGCRTAQAEHRPTLRRRVRVPRAFECPRRPDKRATTRCC
jgi:hypothetical protein